MPNKAPILVIDNDRATLKRVDDALQDDAYTVHAARTADEGWRVFDQVHPRAVLVDPQVPRRSDVELLRQLRQHADDTEILFLLRPDDPGTVDPRRANAKLVLTKPLEPGDVRTAVQQALGGPAPTAAPRDGGQAPEDDSALVGSSPRFREALEMARSVAPTDASVLIHGESGTGKEMVADLIYRHSARADRPFVKLNCAALPRELIEAELFGYRRGAFTGAGQDRDGVLETADGGTLLLDEIGEMPANLQTKLLRVLQEHEFRPVGSTDTVRADFRVIATTNIDLEESLRNGSLRDDLYYRLSTVTIRLPALRERQEDIPDLARHLLDRYARHHARDTAGFSDEAAALLARHHWPGNVRELENAVEHAVILAGDGTIEPRHLPDTVTGSGETRPGGAGETAVPAGMTLAEIEGAAIAQALERHRFNKQATARALGLHRATLYAKMRRHGIDRTPPASGPR